MDILIVHIVRLFSTIFVENTLQEIFVQDLYGILALGLEYFLSLFNNGYDIQCRKHRRLQ